MDEAALHRRLDAIERRQYLVLTLLVIPYLVGAGRSSSGRSTSGRWSSRVSASYY